MGVSARSTDRDAGPDDIRCGDGRLGRMGQTRSSARAGPDGERVHQLVLAPHPRSAQVARTFVEAFCRAAGIAGDTSDVAVLLTSETVTNAVIHARSEIRLVVTCGAEVLRVDVGDDDARAPEPAEQHSGAVSGRGLSMIDALADDWGVTDDAPGKVVWFRLRTARPGALEG